MPVTITIAREVTEVAEVTFSDLPSDATNEEIHNRIYESDCLDDATWVANTNAIDWDRNNTAPEVDEPTPSE